MPFPLTDTQLNELLEQIPAVAGRPRQLEELSGGLTNRNVKVTTPDGVYVARCTDISSNFLGIDRDEEYYNTKAAVGVLAWKLYMKQAIELPNLIARGNYIAGETDRFSPQILAGLRDRGINLEPGHAENSGLHGLLEHEDGTLEGGADSRREGIVRLLPKTAE